jgi:threonine/homoserine/homoserine lactone efflux protein
MTGQFLVKGVVIGFSIAAPVGPIGVLCIRRTLADGARAGLVSGLGAATADAIYGSVAGFGLTSVSRVLEGQRFWLGLIGGGFLCYLGLHTFLSVPASKEAGARTASGLFGAYLSTFLLTMANPATILSFLAVFAGLGLGASPDYAAATSLVAGVFLGSALWWLLLSGGVGLARCRLGAGWMRAVNRLSGSFLFAFGVYTLLLITRGS